MIKKITLIGIQVTAIVILLLSLFEVYTNNYLNVISYFIIAASVVIIHFMKRGEQEKQPSETFL